MWNGLGCGLVVFRRPRDSFLQSTQSHLPRPRRRLFQRTMTSLSTQHGQPSSGASSYLNARLQVGGRALRAAARHCPADAGECVRGWGGNPVVVVAPPPRHCGAPGGALTDAPCAAPCRRTRKLFVTV